MSSHSVTKSDNKNNNDDYEAEKSNACLFQSEIKSYRFRWLIVITLASVCSLLSSLGCVGLGMALWFPDQKAVLLLCLAWLGGFGFAQYSLALEMAAEATYPVPESITTGLLIMASQLVAIVLLPVMQKLAPIAKPNAYFHPVCGPDSSPLDYAIPNLVYCALYVLIAIAQMTFLRLSYVRRLAAQNVQTPISAVEQIPAADTSRHEYWSNLEAPVLRRASL